MESFGLAISDLQLPILQKKYSGTLFRCSANSIDYTPLSTHPGPQLPMVRDTLRGGTGGMNKLA